ncbi:unnamed protein product [Polarella glacialis]|uniref:RING-type domain-containing protein n=1 Tax=Polarella glacialis TaxID=89957 RepID=A0A813M6K2_POLGL|nr:unnamed protein product [Polarella glacialis]
MGLDDARIFDPHAISETLRCSVCHEVFVDPVYCSGRPCQHVFCSACLEEWLEHQTGCPNCREPIRRQDLRRHEVIRSFLDELNIKCTAAGCGWHGRQDAFPGHIEICPVRSLELSRDEALEHIKQRDVEITKMRASAELQLEEVAEKNGIMEAQQASITLSLLQGTLNILEISALREALREAAEEAENDYDESTQRTARLRSELWEARDAKYDLAQQVAALQAEKAKQLASDILPTGPALSVGLLFPGQGSQYVNMLEGVKDLPAVKEMLETAKRILEFDILDVCLNGPESRLGQTKFCQPAIYIAGLAAVEKLRLEHPDKVERCQAVAGLSLGEYTALTVAGVMDFETCLKVVKLRAEAMQEAAGTSEQCMMSVAGLSQEKLAVLCQESCEAPGDVCEIAYCLFPKGFSCSGSAMAVERLMAKALQTKGCLQAKMMLNSGGSHTRLMAPARERLLAALRDAEPHMRPPRCDVYLNVTGKRIAPGTQPSELIQLMGDQLCSCVLWEPAVRAMIADGVTEFHECGPMEQLKAMMRRIDAEAFKNTNTVDV